MSPDELFESNKKLVFFVVSRMLNNSSNINDVGVIDREDMEQMGMIGLWKASKNFDSSTGFKFSTYAVPAITGEIINSVRENHGSIKVPRKAKQASKVIAKRIQDGEELPTVQDIYKEFELSLSDSRIALELLEIKLISTEIPVKAYGNNRDMYLSDIIADENAYFEEKIIKNEELKEVLSILDGRERQIFYYTMAEVTQKEIAKKLGISQVQVSRIYRRAINKAKKYYEVLNNENQPQFA